MTFRTGHLAVGGSPPRLHIDIHLVTEAAESGGLYKSQQCPKEDNKNKNAKNKANLDCLKVSLSPSSRCVEDIDTKGLDQIIKAF